MSFMEAGDGHPEERYPDYPEAVKKTQQLKPLEFSDSSLLAVFESFINLINPSINHAFCRKVAEGLVELTEAWGQNPDNKAAFEAAEKRIKRNIGQAILKLGSEN